MNEQIFELARQADLIQWDMLPSGARTPDHESVAKAMKFAELIVRECSEVLRKEMDRLDTIPGRELSAQCFETAGVLVLNHFGVK